MRLNRSNKALLIGPALIVVLAFAGLLTFSQLAPLVSQRAATLSHALDDTSLSDRLHRWRAACRMASERPVAGWGLGAWLVMQGRWTHQGDDVPEVLASGTGHSNLAHNFWVQWAAETGGVGLGLHVALVAAFFAFSLRAPATAQARAPDAAAGLPGGRRLGLWGHGGRSLVHVSRRLVVVLALDRPGNVASARG